MPDFDHDAFGCVTILVSGAIMILLCWVLIEYIIESF